jgi:DNA polymerase-3 subunit alpha
VYWDEVAGLEETGVEEVYDLTVEGTHNFVAGDLVVHNSHSAAYSLVAYQTGYLKAHYPAEFMAAAMTNDMGSNDKLAVVLEEARRMGLEVRPPCVNRSAAHFTVDDGAIRFGLGAVKGAGLGAIEALLATRAEHGPFETLFRLTKDLDLRQAGKRTLECLAQAGALDRLEGHRAQLAEAVDLAVRYGQKVQADRAAGQSSLFGSGEIGGADTEPDLPSVEPWSTSAQLKAEHEVLGFYVSGHPLDDYRAEAEAFATARFGEVDRLEALVAAAGGDGQAGGGGGRDRGPVRAFCGILTEVKRTTTRSGKPIAFCRMEDFTGAGELVCFASVLDRVSQYLKVDEVVLVKGNVEVRGGEVQAIVKDVLPMWKVREQLVEALVVQFDAEALTPHDVETLRALCDRHRGRCKLYFDVRGPGMRRPQRVLARAMVVEPTSELMRGLHRVVGPANVRLEGAA